MPGELKNPARSSNAGTGEVTVKCILSLPKFDFLIINLVIKIYPIRSLTLQRSISRSGCN